MGSVIDARAAGKPLAGDTPEEDLVGAEVWQDDAVVMPPESELLVDDAPSVPIQALSHEQLQERYPRSFHRNAAQKGGYLRDLKGVVAFDVPGQPTLHHPVVHLDHHVDGRLTIFTHDERLRLAEVDLAASPVRVVVYGRVEVPLEVRGDAGTTVVPAGTLATFLGVPQDRQEPEPITDWDTVRSLYVQA